MEFSLLTLSQNEWKLYNDTIALEGEIEVRNKQLFDVGIFERYRNIHNQYFELYDKTSNSEIKIEALKRLIFLNWYSVLEPSCFTGIENFDQSTMFKAYSILNDQLNENQLDSEFIWMLSYYSSWDWIILSSSENKLTTLTNFVNNVGNSAAPKNQLPKGTMDNRGQMGIYWNSCSVEIK